MNQAFFTDVTALSAQLCSKPIVAKLVYATKYNFMGRVVDGYIPGADDFALMTVDAANALCQVQNELLEKYNLGLLIYDSCRPKRAVLDFKSWTEQQPADNFELERKAIHYPHREKSDLFAAGYLAEDSQHCYGNTVDLVLINENQCEVQLGACFDYMDELSHWTASKEDIGENAFNNRLILLNAMTKFDFVPYEKEFWHYSHKVKVLNEPLDFVMDSKLQGMGI